MITPIFINNIRTQSNCVNLNFGSITINKRVYTDQEYKLAKKYLNSCNFDTSLRDEIWKAKSGWDRFWGNYLEDTNFTFNEVKRLIKDLKEEMAAKAREGELLRKRTVQKQAEINALKQEQEKKKCLLYGQQILNKRQQIHLNKLTNEKEKRAYIQKTLNDRVLMPLKAEREMNKGERSIDLNALNGIIFKNFNDKDYNETLKWLTKQSGCEIVNLDFGKLSLKDAFGSLLNIFKQASEKKDRTFVRVDNLEKHLVSNSISQKKAIGKFKHLLQKCSEQYKSILLVNTKNENVLMQESGAPQRFGVKLDISKYNCNNSEITFAPIQDGYNMKHGKQDTRPLKLYLGSYGTKKDILWIESQTPEEIEDVLVNLDKIRALEFFKDVKRVQYPIYDTDQALTGFYKTSGKMWNGQPIYELELKKIGL